MNESAPFEYLYQEEIYSLPPRTLIVLDQAWEDFSQDDKTLLQKILGSVKLNLQMVNVITRKQFSLSDLRPLDPERIICFGAICNQTGNLYEFSTLEGMQIICADGIQKMDDTRKKNLWGALRQMFKI
jgi:hypothetical protein